MPYNQIVLSENPKGASVYLNLKDGKPNYVEKHISKRSYKKWEEEAKILEKVGRDNPNVVTFYPTNTIISQSSETISLCMEFCQGDLDKYILNKELHPIVQDPRVKARDYFLIGLLEVCLQAAKGIHYLHSTHDIIHRDIKPTNFLMYLATNRDVMVKVTDFGLSRVLQPEETSINSLTIGTQSFMAKECYFNRWKKASDVFALGIVLYYAFTTGAHPFGCDGNLQEESIIRGEEPNFDVLKSLNCKDSSVEFTEEQKICCIDLVMRMVKPTPEDRIDINQVRHHPLFWKAEEKVKFYVDIKNYLKNRQEVNERVDKVYQEIEGAALISLDNIPDCLKTRKDHQQHRIRKCDCVYQLLCVVRNQEAHARDSGQSEKIYQCLGFENNTLDYGKFLDTLTGPYPHLLMCLYNFFYGTEAAPSFYPRDHSPSVAKTPSSISTNAISPSFSSPLPSTCPSVLADLDPPKEWEQFFHQHCPPGVSLYTFLIKAVYEGEVVHESKYNIDSTSVKILSFSDKRSALDTGAAAAAEFRLPSGKDNETLKETEGGVTLRVDPVTRDLVANRHCPVWIFCSSHCHQELVKLERNKPTTVFSLQKLHEQIHQDSCSHGNVHGKVHFVFGKDPRENNNWVIFPVVVTIESLAVADVISKCSPANADNSVLISI